MTSAKGEAGAKGQGCDGEGCLAFSVFRGGSGWAWQHIGTLPDYATEKFIHFLLTFHDKTQQLPNLSPTARPSQHPPGPTTTLCNI